jgi:hypothetical protein
MRKTWGLVEGRRDLQISAITGSAFLVLALGNLQIESGTLTVNDHGG